jgi:hypothetical protein
MTASYAIDPTGKLTVTITDDAHTPLEAIITARRGPQGPVVDVAVTPVPLNVVGPFLGIPTGLSGITLSARFTADFVQRDAVATLDGRGELRLGGFVPPHPKEVDPILAGGDTVTMFDLQGESNSPKMALSHVVVRTGRLELKGAGSVTSDGDHATGKLVVSGPVPCTELAGSYVRQSLGGYFGALGADVARSVVAGTVVVTVTVEGDSRDLRATKIVPTVGVGCHVSLSGLAP